MTTNKKAEIYSKQIKQLLEKKWLLIALSLILTSLGAAFTGVLFKAGIYRLEGWRSALLNHFPAWIVLPILGALGGLVSGTLISRFSPAASGSGVSHIMAYLRHRKVAMGLKVGIVKLIAGIIAISSGFPLGPEGPAVQMGGSVGWRMAKLLKTPIAFRRLIVAAGGGAGIAAIFNAPIGGFIYAIEELLNSARPIVLLLVAITTFAADTWADLFQSFGLDKNAEGFVPGLGFLLEKEYTAIIKFFPIDFIYLVGLGIVIGLLAETYCRYILIMQKKGKLWFGQNIVRRMVISGFILGSTFSILPPSFHNIGQLQPLIVIGDINIPKVIGIFIILFFSTGLAASSGAPGGLFFPMLTLGGCIGLACGNWIEALTGHVPTTFVFAGMGAFVAACSRTPITAMFLAFALTKDLLILKPVLVACLASYLIAQLFDNSSIYERQIELEKKEYSIQEIMNRNSFLK